MGNPDIRGFDIAQAQYDNQSDETGYECASPDCGQFVENEGELCHDCEKQAAIDEKADRLRKGED